MAMPIRETPILKGKDAKHFHEHMKEAESEAIPKEHYDRARKVYDQMIRKHR